MSAILKVRKLRHISWPKETERVCSAEAEQPSQQLQNCKAKTKLFIPTEEILDITLQSKGSLISRKTSYLRDALKESLGEVLPPKPSNARPCLRKETIH